MVLPQHDPGPAGGLADPRIDGANAVARSAENLRHFRGDPSMIGKGVRIKFPQRPRLFVFPVNPTDVTMSVMPRLEVTQTLSGTYVDSLGKGVGQGQIAGTCGWGVPYGAPGNGMTGLQRTLELKRLVEEWVNETVQRTTPQEAACDLFIDFSQQMYQVVWGKMDIVQSQGSPFTVAYTLPFTVLYDYNSPVVILPLGQLDQAGAPAADGGTPTVQPGGGAT